MLHFLAFRSGVVTSVFEVFPDEEFFFKSFAKKKDIYRDKSENTCRHITLVTHSKIVICNILKKCLKMVNSNVKPIRGCQNAANNR